MGSWDFWTDRTILACPHTPPRFPGEFSFLSGLFGALRWRVAERVDAAWLAMGPRIRRANAPRVLVGCGPVSAIRRCRGTAPPAPQLWLRKWLRASRSTRS